MSSHTADQILDCAQSLMVEWGYNGFSYADVAQRVAISKPTIHHHFPTKAHLALKVVQRYRGRVGAVMEEGARMAADPVDQLAAYVGYWEACILDDTISFCVCAMLSAERRTLPAEVGAEVAAHFAVLAAWLADLFTRGAASGQFVLSRAPALEAQCFMALIHGAMLSARALQDGAVFSRVAQAAVANLVAPASVVKKQ